MKQSLEKGYSLIELLFVVAILGIVMATAIPRFKVYQSQNKREEAIQNLKQIFMLMQLKYKEDKSYSVGINVNSAGYAYGRETPTTGKCNEASGWPDLIGFKISPCNSSGGPKNLPTYAYVIQVDTDSFLAQACDIARIVSSCKGDQVDNIDRITINERQEINITCDAINGCGATCSEEARTCVGSSGGVNSTPVDPFPAGEVFEGT